ncbi:MAG: glutathione S-transferase, partial [Parvularculaceae bacterium]|nr:glutathione S-transferase [Parvularculaceae bacterium]
MILFGSLTSPFVRACRMAAIELGLEGVVEFEPTFVRPTQPNKDFGQSINPLRRIPALQTEDEDVIIDSRVIIDYMNERASGALIPRDQVSDRLRCFNRHAICAGATEALVSAMYETRIRPEDKRWAAWSDDQIDKAQSALAWCETHADEFETFDLAAIGLVCLIGYAQF